MLTFLEPVWLVLAIPVGAGLWYWRMPGRLLMALRLATVALVLLAMAQLAWRLPVRSGVVVVVADRSASMPADAAAQQRTAIEAIEAEAGARDRVGVVSFGEQAAVESIGGRFSGFTANVGGDGSDVSAAIEVALAQVPQGVPGRVLVLSDGRFTGPSAAGVLAQASGRGVAVDVRSLQRATAGDLAVERLLTPRRVRPGESYVIAAWLSSPRPQTVAVELRRGGSVLVSGTQEVGAGLTRVLLRDRAPDAGVLRYELSVRPVEGELDDTPQNNAAVALVGVEGQRPILHVSGVSAGGGTFGGLLRGGKLPVVTAPPEALRWTLDELAGYSAVVLENVPADALGRDALALLPAWVAEGGGGLMMTGGQRSYGPGGYFGSPLEKVLPVSMELRTAHRKLAMSIVVALDRSGSMTAPAGAGKTKMDLANIGTAQVIDLMSPMDEVGVIAVDSEPHVVQDLTKATDKAALRARVLRIESMGGGIYVYEALKAAAAMQTQSTLATRHIILFADAADAEEPGDYVNLLAHCRAAGITVSVIGLGTPRDSDAALLQDVAARGGGRVFFTDKPEDLPRLFAQDTFAVARSTFLSDPVGVELTPGLATVMGRAFGGDDAAGLSVGGYNLTYLRPGATLGAVTRDEYAAPLIASWRAGVGRVLAYGGEVDGKHTGAIAQWPRVGEWLSSLVRWTAGDDAKLPRGVVATQDVAGGAVRVTLHLPPGIGAAMGRPPEVAFLRGEPGEEPTAEVVPMRFDAVDELVAEVALRGGEVVLPTVRWGGEQPVVVTMAPVTLPYSPEYAIADARRSGEQLRALARATGGVERVELATIWDDLPPRAVLVALSPWLLVVAAVVLVLEVLERRTGAVSGMGSMRWPTALRWRRSAGDVAAAEGEDAPVAVPRSRGKRDRPSKALAPVSPPDPATPPTAPTPTPPRPAAGGGDSVLGALREVRRRRGEGDR
mgnify:CR=1 FL=1